MCDDLIPVRKMCEEHDVTARALRFYEAEGLLSPERRGNARWYGAGDRTRLKLILRGTRYGLTIGEIRDLLALYDPANGNTEQLRAAHATGKRQLDMLLRRQRELTSAIDELKRELDDVSRQLDLGKTPDAS